MKEQQGLALLTALIMLVVLAVLVTAHFFTTSVELATTKATADGTTGFYAAEAGLNLRGEAIRQRFLGYSLPSGTSPDQAAPCKEGSPGSGDFACQDYTVNHRTVTTYVVEDPGNALGGLQIVIPPGELFGGLNALESRYSVFSEAKPPGDDRPEARLEMVFRSRLVPMFQFAAFYDKDLEILPGQDMLLNGRVHVNGDLYLNAGTILEITGQVTVSERADGTGGDLYRRRKDRAECTGTVRVDDRDASTNPNPAVGCGSPVLQEVLDAWNGQIRTGLDMLTVPEPKEFEPGEFYWRQADVRVVLNLFADPPRIEVRRADQTVDWLATDVLNDATNPTCSALDAAPPYLGVPGSFGVPHPAPGTRAVEWSNGTFFDNREESNIWMLELDVQAFFNCLTQNSDTFFGFGIDIDEASGGGQVWYLSVFGLQSDAVNNYGVRLRNGSRLGATVPGAPQIRGLTVVTDQAAYIQGDYNLDGPGGADWRPASVLADSLNILSNAWSASGKDADSTVFSNPEWNQRRRAVNTSVNAAFLAGTDTTGNQEGVGGQGGAYNGGLENYPRLHEHWTDRTLAYQGSFVSLDRPRRVDGAWRYGRPVYTAPNRNWRYDTRFNNLNSLPPLTPQFVYLRQELFVRDFER